MILRTCARAGCWYEWGIHAEAFAGQVGLTPAEIEATAIEEASDPLTAATDELHDHSRWSDGTWRALRERYTDEQLIELLVLAGWYRMISYVVTNLLDGEDARQDRIRDRPAHR